MSTRPRLRKGPPRPARRLDRRPASEYFSDFFENASDIILINDREGRILAANRVAREFGGYTAADVERGVHLSDVMLPDECAAAIMFTGRALDGLSIPEVYEREVKLRDGGRRIVELRSNVLRRRGRPYALQTIGRDVTEKKEAAAFQASLLQVSQALLTAQSLDALGRIICEEASRVLHVDGAYLWLRRGDDLVGYAAAGRGASEFIGLRRPLDGSMIGEIYRASDVLVINDFPQSLYANAEETRLAAAFAVQAMLAVSLRRSEPAVGVLVFVDTRNPRRFTSTLRERAMIFGAQTTVAIESALAREREEEEGRVSAALLRVTGAIREPLEEVEVLQQIARSAREALDCDWSLVALLDGAGEGFHIAALEGWPPETADEMKLLHLRRGSLALIAEVFDHETVEIPEPYGNLALYQRWNVSSLRIVPMLRAGRVVGALGVGYRQRTGPFSDRQRRISDGVAAQAAVAVENTRLLEDLRRANQLKSEFLGMMSHELRTPLNAILGYADLMHDRTLGPLGTEQVAALERMLVNGHALLDLINMTLDVNRLDAGRNPIRPSDFRVVELFNELREEFAMRAQAGGITLSWTDGASVPPLFTDRRKLKTVLRNLIDNAVKFTPAEGAVVVGVHCLGDAERVCFSVQDTGIGVAPEARATIFEMFRQLETPLPSRGGVGLGLYLVQRYSDLLGGSITVESTPAQGSTFTVEIPRRVSGI